MTGTTDNGCGDNPDLVWVLRNCDRPVECSELMDAAAEEITRLRAEIAAGAAGGYLERNRPQETRPRNRRAPPMTDVNNLVDMLRAGVSGPHREGREYIIAHNLTPDTVLRAADEIERLRALINRPAPPSPRWVRQKSNSRG